MLTPKKRKYLKARLSGENITQSAVYAGYSKKTARQAGSRLERDPSIIEHLARKGLVNPTQKQHRKEVTEPEKKYPVADDRGTEEKKIEDNSVKPVEESTRVSNVLNEKGVEIKKLRSSIKTKRFNSPLEFMKHVMNDEEEDPKLRLEASKALASFTIQRPGDKGKKAGREEKAKDAHSNGRFSSAPAPLKAVK